MDGRKDTAVEALLEHLIEHGPGDIATVFGRAFELAMQIERERFLRAGPYERTAERQGDPTNAERRQRPVVGGERALHVQVGYTDVIERSLAWRELAGAGS